jgi:hypothetical protein
LFEAYAIRTLQSGGTFFLRRLCVGRTTETKDLVVPPLVNLPIVVETNSLTEATVPFDSLRHLDATTGKQPARLLWPTTTNFPTFGCFYIDENGFPWPMQMTIAKPHGLKNSGAVNVIKYFDKMLQTCKLGKYSAVFVVPEDIARIYQAQTFAGPPGKNHSDADIVNVAGRYEQWVMGV